MSTKIWLALIVIILVGLGGFLYLSQQPVVDIKDVTLGSNTIAENYSSTLSFRVESGWNLPDVVYNVELRIEAPEILTFYVAGVGQLRRSGTTWYLPLGNLAKPFNMPIALMVRAGRLPALTSSITSSVTIKVYLGGEFKNSKTINITVSKAVTS
jgi:hypothetical protein